jgi:hypothetical protein
MFGQTKKSAQSDPPPKPAEVEEPPKRPSGSHATDEPRTYGMSKDTSRMGGPSGGPARKVTLLQGSPGAPAAPTPTPGPYTAQIIDAPPPPGPSPYAASILEPPAPPPPAQGGVSRPTAFAATLQTPSVPGQPMPGPGRSPLPPSRPPLRVSADWQPPVIRPKEAAQDAVEAPKKSKFPLVVFLAIALTVVLVVVAIVVNELPR